MEQCQLLFSSGLVSHIWKIESQMIERSRQKGRLMDTPSVNENSPMPGTAVRTSSGEARSETSRTSVTPVTLASHGDDEEAQDRRGFIPGVVAFWKKINNDWIFNLAGLLAYNFLLTLFPIMLLLLAGVGALIGLINVDAQIKLELAIASALPGSIGTLLVREILANLKGSVSLLLIVGLIGAFVAGSRLFITLENCFGIIFRLRGRNIIQQNLMAVGMLVLYLLLVPVVFLGSLLPSLLQAFLPLGTLAFVPRWLTDSAQPLIALVVTTFVVGMTYAFVPHRPMRWRTLGENWKGAVVAAILLLLYE